MYETDLDWKKNLDKEFIQYQNRKDDMVNNVKKGFDTRIDLSIQDQRWHNRNTYYSNFKESISLSNYNVGHLRDRILYFHKLEYREITRELEYWKNHKKELIEEEGGTLGGYFFGVPMEQLHSEMFLETAPTL